ncbi:hypothetical protein B0A52_08707 [Exophiala mesophila]|uniref:SHSP domain-containing protein n=1 Tax=Exophiala mesophila TaxID=212818 RepID=A0A438MYY5_EXOME|nr:hypothetical protein B0A52_08707 [Exophiala mesophila]
MPPIYLLNPPPNPFWDFVAGLEDHPFFAQQRRPVPGTPPQQPPRPNQQPAQPTAGSSDKGKAKQADATATEDPPEVDPSTVCPEGSKNGPFRGRGRFARAFDNDNDDTIESSDRHGPRGHHGHGGRHGPPPSAFGPSPFMFGPPWLRTHYPVPGDFPQGPHGPPPQRGGPFGGRGGHCGRGRGGPQRHHHHRPSRDSPSPPRNTGGFDLATFLNNLGERIGIDFSGTIEGLGLEVDRFKAGRTGTDVDFEPRTDIFESPAAYIIHLSLPGAKKSDVGVDWDGEHSVLRIGGVVHRPGVDEELMRQLTVDGRKRETGVFEKNIRLGTKKDPASIDVASISAKMSDGVLIVRVPKIEKHFEKKEVPVDGSPDAHADKPEDAYMNEKDLLFDADDDKDEDMYDSAPEPEHKSAPEVQTPAPTTKQQEAEENRQQSRSPTVDFESPQDRQQPVAETLPAYQAEANQVHDDEMSDWEKSGTDDEGDYVKINVD